MNKWKLFFDIVFIIQSDVIDFNDHFDAFDIIDKYSTLRKIAKKIEEYTIKLKLITRWEDRRSTVSRPKVYRCPICDKRMPTIPPSDPGTVWCTECFNNYEIAQEDLKEKERKFTWEDRFVGETKKVEIPLSYGDAYCPRCHNPMERHDENGKYHHHQCISCGVKERLRRYIEKKEKTLETVDIVNDPPNVINEVIKKEEKEKKEENSINPHDDNDPYECWNCHEFILASEEFGDKYCKKLEIYVNLYAKACDGMWFNGRKCGECVNFKTCQEHINFCHEETLACERYVKEEDL